jgi:integrase
MLTPEIIAAIPDGKTLTVASGLRLFRRRELVQWQVKYYAAGKRQTKVLGTYPALDTEAALAAAVKVRGEPVAKTAPKATPIAAAVAQVISFGQVAQEWLKHDDSKAPRTLKQHTQLIRRLKPLHDLPLKDITLFQVRDVLEAIQDTGKRQTAHRAKFVASNIFKHAQRHGIDTDPTARIKLKPFKTEHHAAIVDRAQFAALAIDVSLAAFEPDSARVSNALRLLMLTAVRQGELTGATWGEFKDLDKPTLARWEIPAARMKMKVAHIVPLSTQALAIVLAQRTAQGNPDAHKFVFPGNGNAAANRHMSGSALSVGLNALGYQGRHTPHGFRSAFSTLAHEANKDHRLIEMCLAHKDCDKVSASYNSATQVSARRELLQWYADEIDSLTGA